MRRYRSRSDVPEEWPGALRLVVAAAERECPPGHAGALRELTAIALRKVPARGIFDPGVHGEEDLFAAIETVAATHLELGDARREWRKALEAGSLTLVQRDGLEQAATHVQNASDTAYFYTGLAFGLAFVYVHRTS